MKSISQSNREMTTFRCLSINTDYSNREPAAKGDKLYNAVLQVAKNDLNTATLPSFIAVQEIGPVIGGKLIKHCSDHYEGIVKPISYDCGVLMWRKDRWELRSVKDSHASNMGHFMSVKLYNKATDETVTLYNTHQVKEGRGFETHREFRKCIAASYRQEKSDNHVAAGDFNIKASNMPDHYPKCKYAFKNDDVTTSKSGCLDNVITPKLNATFTYKEVLSKVTSFSHRPVVALYAAKRECF